MSGQLHVSVASPPRKLPLVPRSGRYGEENKSCSPAKNRNKIPLSSSPYPSHSVDLAAQFISDKEDLLKDVHNLCPSRMLFCNQIDDGWNV